MYIHKILFFVNPAADIRNIYGSSISTHNNIISGTSVLTFSSGQCSIATLPGPTSAKSFTHMSSVVDVSSLRICITASDHFTEFIHEGTTSDSVNS